MVKIIVSIIMALSLAEGAEANLFEQKCLPCHQGYPVTLEEMFKNYLLIYSGEVNVKAGIKHYLQYPLSDISAMSELFKNTYGIKKRTTLSSDELDEIVDIYWDKYKVLGKLQ